MRIRPSSGDRRPFQRRRQPPRSASVPIETVVCCDAQVDLPSRVHELRELVISPGNRLEALKGSRRGRHSIRINDQFRICFRWEEGYGDDVEVTDYQ